MWYCILVIFSLASSSLYAQNTIYRCGNEYVTNIEYDKYPDFSKKECTPLRTQSNVISKGDAAAKSNSALGQTQADKKATEKKSQQEKVVKAPEAVEWNPNDGIFSIDSKIPPEFNGTSLKAILDWISARYPATKGEFEKQSEYDEKRIAVESQILNKNYAFRVGNDVLSALKYDKYDADSESYVPYPYGSISGTLKENIETKHSDLGTYSASNAYGKTVQVRKFFIKSYGVVIDGSHLLRSGMFSQENSRIKLTMNLKVPIDIAKTIKKGNINFLLIGELQSAAITEESVCVEPRIDSPSTGCMSSQYIAVKPKKIVVYEYESGQILYEKHLEDL